MWSNVQLGFLLVGYLLPTLPKFKCQFRWENSHFYRLFTLIVRMGRFIGAMTGDEMGFSIYLIFMYESRKMRWLKIW